MSCLALAYRPIGMYYDPNEIDNWTCDYESCLDVMDPLACINIDATVNDLLSCDYMMNVVFVMGL